MKSIARSVIDRIDSVQCKPLHSEVHAGAWSELEKEQAEAKSEGICLMCYMNKAMSGDELCKGCRDETNSKSIKELMIEAGIE
jgi:hypothetical protein